MGAQYFWGTLCFDPLWLCPDHICVPFNGKQERQRKLLIDSFIDYFRSMSFPPYQRSKYRQSLLLFCQFVDVLSQLLISDGRRSASVILRRFVLEHFIHRVFCTALGVFSAVECVGPVCCAAERVAGPGWRPPPHVPRRRATRHAPVHSHAGSALRVAWLVLIILHFLTRLVYSALHIMNR